MAEEIEFENGRISNFKGLVTLTLTLDRVILHTVVHHSSTSIYTPHVIEIEETFCGQTDVRTYVRTHIRYIRTDGHLRPALSNRFCRRVDLKRHVQISPNFLYVLPMAVVQSSSDGNATYYVLPVLWMTSCFI